MAYKKVFGKSGEDIAALFFMDKGFEIVEKNWRCKCGEIDLIVRKAQEWRFVEVKTRSSTLYGYPEEAVNANKREHFYAAIEWYIQDEKLHKAEMHADILAIILNDFEFDVRWIQDA